MAVITTKYDIGDSVWFANITTEMRSHPCPDCQGSRTWVATSPAGGSFSVPCPRCATSYQSSDALNLKYALWVPTARRLTIGSLRADTSDEGGPQYMCCETGVGSGSIYRETDLFETEAEALAAAQVKADRNNADAEGWVAKQYDKTAKFCDYELRDAEIAAAKGSADRAWSQVRRLVEDLEDAESVTDVRQRIEEWREAAA